ncbi:MAG: hypothetical protein WCI18_14465 [Pseudomonadota bacterium]
MKYFETFAITAIFLVTGSGMSFAKPTSIKVAILENLKFEKLSTDKYANDYMDGILTASDAAKSYGYAIDIRTFFYDKEPLAILKKVPEVKDWSPDLVIGPRSSSLFLLLKEQFKDVLVISPFATSSEVSSMPDNFYSMTLPNEYFTQAVVNIARQRFPNAAIAPIGEVDCKNCMDFISTFSSFAAIAKVNVRESTKFLNKNAESVPPQELLTHYQKGDVILLPNTSYTSGTLIGRLSDHLRDSSITFIGGDGWGDWSSSYVGKVKSTFSYSAYRATPWSLHATDGRAIVFKEQFRKYRKMEPTGAVSLLSYSALTAPIKALAGFKITNKTTLVREQILEALRKVRQNDQNYGRPTMYAVYKVTQAGEAFDGEVSALIDNQDRSKK